MTYVGERKRLCPTANSMIYWEPAARADLHECVTLGSGALERQSSGRGFQCQWLGNGFFGVGYTGDVTGPWVTRVTIYWCLPSHVESTDKRIAPSQCAAVRTVTETRPFQSSQG